MGKTRAKPKTNSSRHNQASSNASSHKRDRAKSAATARAKRKKIAGRMRDTVIDGKDMLDEELEFSERQVRKEPFAWWGFTFYLIFLGTFFWATVMVRKDGCNPRTAAALPLVTGEFP